MTRRPRILAALGALVVVSVIAGVLVGGAIRGPGTPGGPAGSGSGAGAAGSLAIVTPQPTPVPTPGHEVYGFLPYWEMDASISAHLAGTDLSTLALFSVTNRANGTLDTTQNGYLKISGPLGRQLITEAHDRGSRVELVFTSFGTARNKRLFSGANAATTQGKVVSALVDLAGQLGLDGINVDVEQIDDLLI